MTDSAWGLLGLEPTRDASAIRRAYARRLKLTRPDEDAEGFQALLAARERALAEARRLPAETSPEDEEAPGGGEEPADEPAGAARGIDDRVQVSEEAGPTAPAAESPPPERPLVRDLDVPAPPAAREAPILLVRDLASPPAAPDPVSSPDVPVPLVIDIAPLEAGPAEWQEARALEADLPPFLRDGADSLDAWLARARRLPAGPRALAETALLRALFGLWRSPDGRITAKRIAATRPAILRAAPVFGWPREDAVLAACFDAQDAAIATQILRDVIPPEPGDPAVVAVPVFPRGRLPLQASDARAFLESAPHALKAYEAMRRRMPPPRRLCPYALLAPHVWAVAHRRWGVALAALAGLWLSFLLSNVAIDESGGRAIALGVLALLVWAGTAAVTAVRADRIQIAAAARAARRAGRKGVFAPAERGARLRKAGARMGGWGWLALLWGGSIAFIGPYFGLAAMITTLLGG
ncbi:hypothetical protein MPPM_1265 [Methylorubrum populi]|uniref:J domain-containing protein n=1 Tax=Methylorubrum populi TaxID=223967 RepID=A0A160PEV2_9HYPH|nr:hypothetical protein [Methylorubrum populi]BAU89870.1 hypothetical protein MPPM_1265 [Methylorubrum populi]